MMPDILVNSEDKLENAEVTFCAISNGNWFIMPENRLAMLSNASVNPEMKEGSMAKTAESSVNKRLRPKVTAAPKRTMKIKTAITPDAFLSIRNLPCINRARGWASAAMKYPRIKGSRTGSKYFRQAHTSRSMAEKKAKLSRNFFFFSSLMKFTDALPCRLLSA